MALPTRAQIIVYSKDGTQGIYWGGDGWVYDQNGARVPVTYVQAFLIAAGAGGGSASSVTTFINSTYPTLAPLAWADYQAGGSGAGKNVPVTTGTFFLTTVAWTGPQGPNEPGGTVTPPAAPYAAGTTVPLMAVPAPGYTFVNWSGDVSGTTPVTTIVMNDNKSAIALFAKSSGVPNIPAPSTFTLTTVSNNTSAGTVSPPSGSYPAGTPVPIFAVVLNPAYSFTGWSGDAQGTSPVSSVTLDANKKVQANFGTGSTPQIPVTPPTITYPGTTPPASTFTLSASVSPSEGGVVAPSSGTYAAGSPVLLTAVPNPGYQFHSWSGSLQGTTSPALLTINANSTVVANFSEISNLGKSGHTITLPKFLFFPEVDFNLPF